MLYLDQQYAREMVAHSLEDDPNECCGILAGREGEILNLYRMANVEASPLPLSHGPQGTPQGIPRD